MESDLNILYNFARLILLPHPHVSLSFRISVPPKNFEQVDRFSSNFTWISYHWRRPNFHIFFISYHW